MVGQARHTKYTHTKRARCVCFFLRAPSMNNTHTHNTSGGARERVITDLRLSGKRGAREDIDSSARFKWRAALGASHVCVPRDSHIVYLRDERRPKERFFFLFF